MKSLPKQIEESVLRQVLKRLHYPLDVMLLCVRWYAAYARSWRMDETYIQVGGQWKYLYRAVDRLGHTVDFLLTAKRDHAAARRFFERAIGLHDVPEKITIDKSGANTAAVNSLIADSGLEITLRQSTYLNNLVEQDHRAIKRRT